MKQPVLYLIFNRLYAVEQTLPAIAKAKPPRLYIACDGSREDKEGEKEQVDAVRKWVLENITWDCEVNTRFLDVNLGCAQAISSAITWFFEHEEEGIILEDDCKPNLSFFRFCEELLEYYRDNKKIFHIGGSIFPVLGDGGNDASYYFTQYGHPWGWATWKDRWVQFDIDLDDDHYDIKYFSKFSPRPSIGQFLWDHYLGRKVHMSWSLVWALTFLGKGCFAVTTNKNFISNIGCTGVNYSEGSVSASRDLYRETHELGEIIHPKKIQITQTIEDKLMESMMPQYCQPIELDTILKYVRRRPFAFLFRKVFWRQVYSYCLDRGYIEGYKR